MVDIGAIRCPLFVPANRPERFAKAALSGADAVILDLEDAIAAKDKDSARGALRCDFTSLPVIVRVNAIGTTWHMHDLAAVAGLPLAAVMLPKAEDPAACAAVARLTGKPVIALVETALGLAQARAIAAAPGVVRLAFGSIDFCADLGCAHTHDILLPVRLELVLASRLARIDAPIDGVTVVLDDPAISQADAGHARTLGMTGKLCIHPRQIAAIRAALGPSPAETDWAHRVLASGDGAVTLDGEMVDEPVRVRARAILAASS
ncbi:MAG: CoA ester lyase [Pseudotabrizicola sp.]|uniref:HpcH/HpaI aldolase/citrate lyase family protein n=1 Tax=Pseudotabrizicola sp. TaxID=2939647 RepID=UPI002718E99E|nr:CoA ester lyase [Pseudotabrizicola sp.]MDO9638305.1 CoA ester lyase [Pseudotabrizicola sp.]